MRLTRILDILVLLLLATLIVMPRPDATVKAALPLVPERRERVAELQAHLIGAPVPGVPPCEDAIRSRIALLRDTLERVKGIDMRHNPALAKDKIFEGLHPVWLMKRAPGAAAKAAAPAGKPGAPPPPPQK